jgi:signal transduction histidine kinase
MRYERLSLKEGPEWSGDALAALEAGLTGDAPGASSMGAHLATIFSLERELDAKRALESELRASLEAASEAARRQDAFLATLVHELRGHLAPIRHALHIAASSRATEAQQVWARDVIERQSRQMALMLGDVLEGSRSASGIGPLRIELTDIAAIIDAAVETASPVLDSKQHRLVIERPTEPLQCEVDPRRIVQVVANLLTNAAKYTDPQGEIRLKVSGTGSILTLCVTDNGIGLPVDSLEAIFDLYTQLRSSKDRSEGGVGIGLALARHLVTRHGGTIEARSDGLGRGSDFIVQLPRYRDLAPAQTGVEA